MVRRPSHRYVYKRRLAAGCLAAGCLAYGEFSCHRPDGKWPLPAVHGRGAAQERARGELLTAPRPNVWVRAGLWSALPGPLPVLACGAVVTSVGDVTDFHMQRLHTVKTHGAFRGLKHPQVTTS